MLSHRHGHAARIAALMACALLAGCKSGTGRTKNDAGADAGHEPSPPPDAAADLPSDPAADPAGDGGGEARAEAGAEATDAPPDAAGDLVQDRPATEPLPPEDAAPDAPPYQLCHDKSTCASGFCVDGVCCDTACDGTCEICNILPHIGTCTPIPDGIDPFDECPGADTCGGVCNGARGCRFPGPSTACGATTCESPTSISGSLCDGKGACVAASTAACSSGVCADGFCCATACGACQRCDLSPGTCTAVAANTDPDMDCGPYTCDGGGACRTACASDGECKSSAFCGKPSGGACQPKKTDGSACAGDGVDSTGNHQCASGLCLTGMCGPPSCSKDADCPTSYYCKSATGACAACTATTDDDGDGYFSARCGGNDCDDHDPATHPGAADPADISVDGSLVTVDSMAEDTAGGSAALEPQVSAAFDGTTLAVAFRSPFYALKLRRDDGAGGWTSAETIDDTLNTFGSPAIAYDGAGAAYVLYRYYDGTGRGLSFRTKPSGGTWSKRAEVSATGGFMTRMVLDAAGGLHAVDLDQGTSSVRYFHRPAGGAWTAAETIDSSVKTTLGTPAIAVDASGDVHVTYPDGTTPAKLIHATRPAAGPPWTFETVDSDAALDVGGWSSLSVDGAGHLEAVYVAKTAAGAELRFSTNAAGSWVKATVDPAIRSGGGFTSLAIDPIGAHVAYFKGDPDFDLAYATNLSGTWSTFVVDGTATAGFVQPVIQVAADHKLRIVYFAEQKTAILHAALTATNMKDQDCDGK